MASAICPGGCFVTFDRARCYVAIFVLDKTIMNEQQDVPPSLAEYCFVNRTIDNRNMMWIAIGRFEAFDRWITLALL